MPRIELETEIKSTLEICFDLSRSIDLHRLSTAKTSEQAIAGTTKGLLNLNEWVTWQATHFGIRQKLTSKITSFDRPNFFEDDYWVNVPGYSYDISPDGKQFLLIRAVGKTETHEIKVLQNFFR